MNRFRKLRSRTSVPKKSSSSFFTLNLSVLLTHTFSVPYAIDCVDPVLRVLPTAICGGCSWFKKLFFFMLPTLETATVSLLVASFHIHFMLTLMVFPTVPPDAHKETPCRVDVWVSVVCAPQTVESTTYCPTFCDSACCDCALTCAAACPNARSHIRFSWLNSSSTRFVFRASSPLPKLVDDAPDADRDPDAPAPPAPPWTLLLACLPTCWPCACRVAAADLASCGANATPTPTV